MWVWVPSIPVLSVVDASSGVVVDVELRTSVGVLEALSDEVEAITPALVELTALCIEDVCRVSARVPLRLGAIMALEPVGNAERLNVTPGWFVVIVLVRPPGRPVFVSDGCNGEVEFAPVPIRDNDVSVSLAGTWVADIDEIRVFVRLVAASVTELKNEKATVLKSSVLDLMLDTYTVEKVAVTMPDVKGLLG